MIQLWWSRKSVLTAALIAGLASLPADRADADGEAQWIECWWRTSASAVRVGQPFTTVLTCGVHETQSATVVVDHAKLNPVAVQMMPFEVLGGTRAPDLRATDRHFFQYEYTLRIVDDSLFGQDVPLPELAVAYRVQTRAGQGAVQGAERTYVLPSESVKVISVVPRDASDIRDSSRTTFAEIDAASFRANTLVTVGRVISSLGGLLVLVALAQLVARYRGAIVSTDGRLPETSVLRGVGRELARIRAIREDTGWTRELAARALAALRIVAALALGRSVTQVAAATGGDGSDGAVVIRGGLLRGQPVLVSASVTPQMIAREVDRTPLARRHGVQRLEQLQRVLASFTAASYGGSEDAGGPALDEALDSGRRLQQRLAIERRWLMKQIGTLRRGVAELRERLWSR